MREERGSTMCKSDEYEPYMTLETPASPTDPDVPFWEPSAVANETFDCSQGMASADLNNASSDLLWESPSDPTGLWASPAMHHEGRAGTWEPSSDATVNDVWLWKPPTVADAASAMWEPSTVAHASDGAWKPSYVVNDSSDGLWKQEQPTYAVNVGSEWKPSTLPSGSTEALWGAPSDTAFLEPSFVGNGSGLWDAAGPAVPTIRQELAPSLGGEADDAEAGVIGNGTSCFGCNLCMNVFTSHDQLKLHLESAHKKIYPCSECDKSFTTPFSMRRHFDEFHEVGKPKNKSHSYVRCTHCTKVFSTMFSMQRHYDMFHNPDKPKVGPKTTVSCNECSKTFGSGWALRRHYKVHGIEIQTEDTARKEERKEEKSHFACDSCPKTFTSATKFNLHMHMHAGTMAFPCSECPTTFLTAPELNRHFTRVHARRYSCTFCPGKFGFMNDLTRHLLTHSSKASLACALCSSTFALYPYLNKHYRRVHKILDPYDCVICGQKFSTMVMLEQHQKYVCSVSAHTAGPGDAAGVRPYWFDCPTCGMRFGDEKNLGNHLLSHKTGVHMGERRRVYRCSICARCFGKPLSLRNHLALHGVEGKGSHGVLVHEDMLFCTDCDEAYSSETDLLQHARTQHGTLGYRAGSKAFSCSLCLHKFDEDGELLQHLNRHLGR